jgi:hypothetical protein
MTNDGPAIEPKPATSRRLREPGKPGGSLTPDQTGESSFPASDPPSVWTWETGAALERGSHSNRSPISRP